MITQWELIENPKDGDLVVYVGVHSVRWQSDWGPPSVAFTRVHVPDYKKKYGEAMLALSDIYEEYINLVGEDDLIPELCDRIEKLFQEKEIQDE